MAVIVYQKLVLGANSLQCLPDELSSLQKLKELDLMGNNFTEPPVSVLEHLTALELINLRNQRCGSGEGTAVFTIPSSLLPVLHPWLQELNLRQEDIAFRWDPISLHHQEGAKTEAAKLRPVPELLF